MHMYSILMDICSLRLNEPWVDLFAMKSAYRANILHLSLYRKKNKKMYLVRCVSLHCYSKYRFSNVQRVHRRFIVSYTIAQEDERRKELILSPSYFFSFPSPYINQRRRRNNRTYMHLFARQQQLSTDEERQTDRQTNTSWQERKTARAEEECIYDRSYLHDGGLHASFSSLSPFSSKHRIQRTQEKNIEIASIEGLLLFIVCIHFSSFFFLLACLSVCVRARLVSFFAANIFTKILLSFRF